MNGTLTPAQKLLCSLRRLAGEEPLSARFKPMQWFEATKEQGLTDSQRREAITSLRISGFVQFKPESTEILAIMPAGIAMADQLILRQHSPQVNDPMPSTIDEICAELDYWELHLYDGDPGSNWWVQVQARIEGLRHKENRLRPLVSITNNLSGPNSRVNQNSIDLSTNLVSQDSGEPNQINLDSESGLERPRFRAINEPLGVFWSAIPAYLKKPPVSEIRLASGPAMWLRLIPAKQSHVDLSLPMQVRQGVMSDGKLCLAPLNWGDIGFLRADDGFGVYARICEADTETSSVAFAFETGGIWAIDTGLLSIAPHALYFGEIQRAMCSRLPHYSRFIQNLGIEPPFRWIAGLDGIKDRRLDVEHPAQGISRLGEPFLRDRIVCHGAYDGAQEPHLNLGPFFREVFKRSSMVYPEHLQN